MSTATPTPALTPTPTPTPIPSVALIAEGDPELAEALREWSELEGWSLLVADPESAIDVLGERGIELKAVVSLGVPFPGDPASIAAPVVLVEVDDARPQNNVSTVGEPGARQDQAGFLAGVMTGLASQTQWVGLVSGGAEASEPKHVAGFRQGLRYGCPKCRLVELPSGEASVDGFRGKGVDAVFPVPGPATIELAGELGSAGVWIVWIGDLPAEVPAGSIAGRVALGLDELILAALEDLIAGKAGAAWPYAIENGGLFLADLNAEAISPGRQRLVREAYDAVALGELDIGIDPETGD